MSRSPTPHRRRVVRSLLAAAAIAVLALLAGGWVGMMLAFCALLILLDAAVPDFYTSPFGDRFPNQQRERLRGR
jgi:hypothetical protein